MFLFKILLNIYFMLTGIVLICIGAVGEVGYNEKVIMIVLGSIVLLLSVCTILINWLDWDLVYQDIYQEAKAEKTKAKYTKLKKQIVELESQIGTENENGRNN